MRQLSPRWLLPVAVLLLLYGLSYAPYWNPDEGRYAATALEMAQPFDGETADWVTPHLNTVPRLNKPPLIYWLTALSYRVFGASEAAGRLVSAVAAIIVLLTLYALGRTMFTEQAGITAALIWSASVLPFSMARILNTDMLLCCAMTLTFGGVWLGLHSNVTAPAERGRFYGYALAGLGMGLALLTKGPVGVALPLAITFVYLARFATDSPAIEIAAQGVPPTVPLRGRQMTSLLPFPQGDGRPKARSRDFNRRAISSKSNHLYRVKRWSMVYWPGIALALTLACAISLPWYGTVAARHPDFLKLFFLQENLARYTGAQEFHKAKPVWFHAPVLLLGLFPWTAYLLPAVARWRAGIGDTSQQQARLYLWLWVGLLLLFFSFSKVKLISYALPAFPALSLLLGETLGDNMHERLTVSYQAAKSLTAFIYLALIIALPIVVLNDHITLLGRVRHLAGDKIMPIAAMRPYILTGGVVLLISLLLMLWPWRELNLWHIVLSQFATAGVLFIVLVNLTSHIAHYEDNSGIVQMLRPLLQQGDRVIQYQTFLPSASFYLRQPVTVVGFPHSSGLDENAMAHSSFFMDSKARTLAQLLYSPQRVYIFIDAGNPARRGLRQPYYVVARCNNCQLLSNRPATPGLHYDFVAPRRRQP